MITAINEPFSPHCGLWDYSATTYPMPAVIIFAQPADDYSPARAGVDELPVLQVDAYMGNSLSRTVAAEEYQVAFLEVPFGYFIAFIFQLFRVSRHLGTIYFPVYLIDHA